MTIEPRLPPALDRRRKLTLEQREEIRLNVDGLSQQRLADRYGISKRMVQFILRPEKLAENLHRREERGGWKQYYDPELHAARIAATREYRKKLKAEGAFTHEPEH
jgi:hypothetical protein